jgi:ATP-dependent 26S proteasome regulatory subunit
MDGLAEDVDVIFVLTTNRVELLEPALAARPGRIDQAVEIKLPDAQSRHRLFELYLRGVDHDVTSAQQLEGLVDRTEGVSAAFIRELVRRALLSNIAEGETVLTAARIDAALTDLLEHSAPVLRSTLGANPDVAMSFEAPSHEGGYQAVQGGVWFEGPDL